MRCHGFVKAASAIAIWIGPASLAFAGGHTNSRISVETVVVFGGQSVTIDQNSQFNIARVIEIGSVNNATIDQSGTKNVASVFQVGAVNNSLIAQFGTTNSATVWQIGSLLNNSLVAQFGNTNSASISQRAPLNYSGVWQFGR